jgi:hypothetical protein
VLRKDRPKRQFQSFTILTQRRQERQENLLFAAFAPLREIKIMKY